MNTSISEKYAPPVLQTRSDVALDHAIRGTSVPAAHSVLNRTSELQKAQHDAVAEAPDHDEGNQGQPRDLNQRVPPVGGRIAWTQVAASFLINMNVYGSVKAFGEFQHFYETEYLAAYSSSTISWIGTVQGALTLFVGALAGPIFDKGYFMLTLKCASIALVFSWMMLSLSTQYYQVCLYGFRVFCKPLTRPLVDDD